MKNRFLNILSIDIYRKIYIFGDKQNLRDIQSPQYNKNQYAISFIGAEDYISTNIHISKNILEEDIYDIISTKVYDELSLDQTIEFQIQFVEISLDSKDGYRNFHIFVVNPACIKDIYKNIIKNITYIDKIVPAPLLIKPLFINNIIDSSHTDCFIYFQEQSSFLSVYDNGNFLFTRSLNYSFIQIYKRFCEIYSNQIEYEKFIEFILNENIRDTNSQYKKYILELYKEIFFNINNILTFIKRTNNIKEIDNIYIGTDIEIRSKLYEIAEVELKIQCKDFKFNYQLQYKEEKQNISHLQSLMQLYALAQEDNIYDCNFTMFKRPAKFTQRDSGKLIISLVVAFILAFSLPLFYLLLAGYLSFQENGIREKLQALKQEKKYIESQKITRNNERNIALKILKREKETYAKKKDILIKINDIKVHYPMKAKLIFDITKYFNRHDVNIQSLEYKQTKNTKLLEINMLTYSDKNITDMLTELTQKYKFNFNVKDIYYEKKIDRYLSKLEIELL